ncbi:UNVERIFIED_CONTAM: hypothetical protein Sradi_4793100 [Sesamum radiatum]|uniref:Uncharacterized protein n=1 Tax=Sesamum radiatum TaxID=300843 RepID=A0AAW2MX54_SESRA
MELNSTPPADGVIAAAVEMPEPDIHVVTSSGMLIPAHSKILVYFSFFETRENLILVSHDIAVEFHFARFPGVLLSVKPSNIHFCLLFELLSDASGSDALISTM